MIHKNDVSIRQYYHVSDLVSFQVTHNNGAQDGDPFYFFVPLNKKDNLLKQNQLLFFGEMVVLSLHNDFFTLFHKY